MASRHYASRASVPTAWFGIALLLLGLGWSCSVREDYETLSFWFDGVPTPEQVEAQRLAEIERESLLLAQKAGQLTSQQRAAMLTVRVKVVDASTHEPVEEKKCTACHVMTGSDAASAAAGWMSDLPELKMPPEQLCLGCHERPVAAFTHGPASSGNCSICHQAHTSLHESLLRNGRQEFLCRSCHQNSTFITEEQHGDLGEQDCVVCHDPHGSERASLLREGVASLSRVDGGGE